MPEKPPETSVRPRPRIESLSDLIFGLALSVGSLALVANPPRTGGALISDVATFGFTFLILISVWFDYTRIMSVMPLNERRTVTLNTLLLFTVSLEPFLFLQLQASGISEAFFQVASQAYAVDLGLMMAILASFTGSLAVDSTVHLEPRYREGFRKESITRFVVAGIFFLSAVPVFGEYTVGIGSFHEPLRILMWFAPALYAIHRRGREQDEHAARE